MAEETKVTEKVYCYDHPSAYHNDNALIGAIMSQNKSQCDPTAMMAMMNNQNSWNTAQIIQASQQNTQRILDQMCANTTQELRDKLAQMSQEAQTAQIIAGLKNSCCQCG